MKQCNVPGCSAETAGHHLSKYCHDHLTTNDLGRKINFLISSRRDKAKKAGIEWSVDYAYIRSLWPDDNLCPVFNRPFRSGDDGEHGRNDSASIDRKDPRKGYVEGNIQIISKLANSMRQNATPEEEVMMAKWMLEVNNEQV